MPNKIKNANPVPGTGFATSSHATATMSPADFKCAYGEALFFGYSYKGINEIPPNLLKQFFEKHVLLTNSSGKCQYKKTNADIKHCLSEIQMHLTGYATKTKIDIPLYYASGILIDLSSFFESVIKHDLHNDISKVDVYEKKLSKILANCLIADLIELMSCFMNLYKAILHNPYTDSKDDFECLKYFIRLNDFFIECNDYLNNN